MRRVRSSDTDSSLRELARSVQLYRIRPRPPRQIKYNGSGVLSWLAPNNTGGITHFRVYGPDENTLIREVPGDQTQVNDLFTVARVFVSSFNQPTELESRKVLLGEEVGMEDGLADDFVEKAPVAGAAGIEHAPLVTGVTFNTQYVVLDIGGQGFRLYGTFTEPSATNYLGMLLVGELGGQRFSQGFFPKGSGGSYTTDYLKVPETPAIDNWTFWFVSVGHNNRSNTILDGTTPKRLQAVTWQVGTGGTNLKLARFFNTSEFNIDPTNGLTMNQLNVDKLLVGSIARFGFNGPGQWAAYDTFNAIVAWGGVNGGFYGLWGKNLWVGGSNPSTAPFFVDSSGNVVIDNTGLTARATMTLVRNSVTTKLVNGIDGVDTVGLDVKSTIDLRQTLIGTSLIILRNAAGANTLIADSGGFLTAAGLISNSYVKIGGNTVIDASRIADFVSLKIGGTERIDSAGNVKPASITMGGNSVVSAGRSITGTNYQIENATVVYEVINTSRQFVGAGAICNAGIAATGFNIFGGTYFGQTGVGTQQVTNVRSNFGVIQIKTQAFDYRGGVVTSIGTESAWTDIDYIV